MPSVLGDGDDVAPSPIPQEESSIIPPDELQDPGPIEVDDASSSKTVEYAEDAEGAVVPEQS
eukprot:1494955-Alexandrium_andersonii.AAC.1